MAAAARAGRPGKGGGLLAKLRNPKIAAAALVGVGGVAFLLFGHKGKGNSSASTPPTVAPATDTGGGGYDQQAAALSDLLDAYGLGQAAAANGSASGSGTGRVGPGPIPLPWVPGPRRPRRKPRHRPVPPRRRG